MREPGKNKKGRNGVEGEMLLFRKREKKKRLELVRETSWVHLRLEIERAYGGCL